MSARAMRTIKVRRRSLVRQSQEWVVDIPAEYDSEEWMANDFGGFDQYVCDNGQLIAEDHHGLDARDLDVEVLS